MEHQRDVLIRCAKLRTQTLDKLNLVDYILDPEHTDEFSVVAPPQGPDLVALQGALAADLDVIADAASYSINNVKDACDPETFMRTVRNTPDFRLTALPPNMPKHDGLPVPAVPELTSMTDIRAVLEVGGFRTATELTAMPTEDQRNTLITVLVVHTNQPVQHYHGLDDRELAGAGGVLVFLRRRGIHTDAEIKAKSDDDLRNKLIDEVHARGGGPIPELQGRDNLDLVALALKVFGIV